MSYERDEMVMREEYADRIAETSVSAEAMLGYLQSLLDKFMKDSEKYGMNDRIVDKEFDAMIACKEMVECLIEMPVNLQKDGKVTVGYC